MQHIIETTSEEIQEAESKMVSTLKVKFNGMPKSGSHSKIDQVWVKHMGVVDILTERYLGALEFIKWFSPAWEKLNKREMKILEKFYGEYRSLNTVYELADEYHFSPRTIHRLKLEAINKFSMLLLGK